MKCHLYSSLHLCLWPNDSVLTETQNQLLVKGFLLTGKYCILLVMYSIISVEEEFMYIFSWMN
jgi:hypothetical protein